MVKTESNLLHASLNKNRLSELLYTFYGGQNGLHELLQVSYTLCLGQTGLCKLPQASYTLYGSQNGLSDLLQASTCFMVGTTDSLNFNNPASRSTDVKN